MPKNIGEVMSVKDFEDGTKLKRPSLSRLVKGDKANMALYGRSLVGLEPETPFL